MAQPAPEAVVADLQRKLDQASADLAKVKRTAGIVTGIVLGGGVIYVAWRLFAAHLQPTEGPTNGT
jgi:hypothetical protein